jgi:hypothetical protein
MLVDAPAPLVAAPVHSFPQFIIHLGGPLQSGSASCFWERAFPVTKMKAILKNPYLLGAQGFLAGAFLLWSGPVPAAGGAAAADRRGPAGPAGHLSV